MTAAGEYHQLLLKTSRIGMFSLVVLCVVEAIAYSPWFAELAPFGLPLQYAGPLLWSCLTFWSAGAVWCVVTLVRGRGAAAVGVGCLCLGFSIGSWVTFGFSVYNHYRWPATEMASRDYVGATVYGVLAVLLFTGRKLARGLLVLSAQQALEAEV